MLSIFDGSFDYEDEGDLIDFINNMGIEESIKILDLGLTQANKAGVFSMKESFCLYKCLLKLKENENKNSNLHNDDNHGDSNK